MAFEISTKFDNEFVKLQNEYEGDETNKDFKVKVGMLKEQFARELREKYAPSDVSEALVKTVFETTYTNGLASDDPMITEDEYSIFFETLAKHS